MDFVRDGVSLVLGVSALACITSFVLSMTVGDNAYKSGEERSKWWWSWFGRTLWAVGITLALRLLLAFIH